MILGFAVGIALVAFVATYAVSDTAIAKTQAYLIGKQFSMPKNNKNTWLTIGALIGLVSGIILTAGTSYATVTGLLFAGLGIVIVEITYRVTVQKKVERRKQECFMLFNAVEIFIQSGCSVPQALSNSRSFTPLLEPCINKCLAAWPSGSVQALEVLKQEINLPEGDQLVSLLLQVHQVGTKNLNNIIQTESKQMEEKRKALAKTRITQKPIFLMVYRLLPLVVLLGMLAGVLVTRIFIQMNAIA